jgi:hypothetical protein
LLVTRNLPPAGFLAINTVPKLAAESGLASLNN